MQKTFNQLERAIIDAVNEKTTNQLTKRIPDIPDIDYRRLTYILIEERIAAYEAAGIKKTLDLILSEFGITKKAYYNWYEKYHSYYKQCKNS